MRIATQVALATLLALGLMALLVIVAEANQWLYFTGWGMFHGGCLLVFPLFWAVSFATLFLFPWFRKAW